MKEAVIRGKMPALLLFAAMIFLSMYFQRRQTETFAVQEANEAAEELPRRVALTFDDGPHPAYTKILLDGLRERGVKATFFVIGKYIPGREEIIRQMAQDGHLIGNHTYDHIDISRLSSEVRRAAKNERSGGTGYRQTDGLCARAVWQLGRQTGLPDFDAPCKMDGRSQRLGYFKYIGNCQKRSDAGRGRRYYFIA